MKLLTDNGGNVTHDLMHTTKEIKLAALGLTFTKSRSI